MAEDRSSNKQSSAHRFFPLSVKRRECGSMTDILKTANQAVENYADDADISCIECGSGGKNQQFIMRANCNQPYHRHCLLPYVRDLAGLWYCRCRSDLPPPVKSTKVEESSKGKPIVD